MQVKRSIFLKSAALVLIVVAVLVADQKFNMVKRIFPSNANIDEVRNRVIPDLRERFRLVGLQFGAQVYIRIFKEEHILELWVERDENYRLFNSYDICNFSGDLGPKLREGDRQSPEGFYRVGTSALNPNSSYHLSFNLGFPNSYDRMHSLTGSYLMVHGNCVSIGCYAMTDPNIEEIYVIAEAALLAGQPVFDVHAFPFRMTEERLAQEVDSEWYSFWQNLKTGYDIFERDLVLPDVSAIDGEYVFGTQS